MNDLDSYRLPAPLVQAITDTLNDLPARISRRMLNAMEVECVQQDKANSIAAESARVEAADAERTAAIEAAVASAVREVKAAAVQAPARPARKGASTK